MTDTCPRRAHGVARVPLQEGFFLRRNGLDTSRTRDEVAVIGKHAKLRPQRLQRFCYRAGLFAWRQIGDHVSQSRVWLCATRVRGFPGFDTEKTPRRAEGKAAVLVP